MKVVNNADHVTEHVDKGSYYGSILKKTWMYLVSLYLVFLVTLSVFPAVCSLIKSTNENKGDWTDTYFIPVICFLLFNAGDFLGRLSTFLFKYPGPDRPGVMLFLCTLRLAFIPLLMLCNAQPRSHLPVVLHNDAFPACLILVMGLTNGYLGTLCMSFGPIGIPEHMAEGAGMTLALAMIFGLASGSGLSLLCVHLL